MPRALTDALPKENVEVVGLMLWNGTTWDRATGSAAGGGAASTIANGADVNQGSTTDIAIVTDIDGTMSGKLRGVVKVLASIWDSVRAQLAVGGPVAVGSAGGVLKPVLIGAMDGTGNVQTPQIRATADAGSAANFALNVAANAFVYNGATLDKARSASAANLSATLGIGVLLAVRPGNWTVVHDPAVATTRATATKAAGAAGVRHVCTSISMCLATGATAQTILTFTLRDGASGAGTVLWSRSILLPANVIWQVDITDLCLPGTAATAMTLESSGAGVAASLQSVTLCGFSTS